MSPVAGTPTGPPGSASSIHQGPQSGTSVNPNAAPGPIPATTPLVVRQDQNGVQWIAFEYSRDRVKMEYTIRCDVESIDVNTLSQEFKSENCVYPRACCSKEQYKGNRLHYETECNTVGWALAQLNPCLRGKRGLIQRAVDSWRNSNQDPRLRSRRVRRMAKISNRKAVQAQQHGPPHMAGPGGPAAPGVGPQSAGIPTPGAPRQAPGLGIGGPQQLHHHHQSGPQSASEQDVSGGADYDPNSHTHHHPPPNGNSHGQAPSGDVRQAHNFYPNYPAPPSANMVPSLPPTHDPMDQSGSHGAAPHAVATSSLPNRKGGDDEDDAETTTALFGDLPEAKRRKFILVDDSQRGTRVRVRVMLDQVRMAEMPDSYRKNNSVYPRSWFATEMQDTENPGPQGRWPEDAEDEDVARGVTGDDGERVKTHVPVQMMDGSESKVPLPKMSRGKRKKEVVLNDLGYRMSWSQSRVFSGRTLFLQRSLDAYRNKMRSTMVAAGQDVANVAPHFETRVGKRKWLERSKKTKGREGSP
ncbi:hypothetical protein NA57DRAFT_30561 [Rhizodiscina lignyota]|uniref:DUF8032 domain-containing protein n=1 Tax=Rhizodiscina lignyota TaxID=1504668 RepID=A0A9P4MB14_9PEZI|nr:hypothetical protein NA57DRAFT_30561 [Rhizodiscina lignyota]